MSKLKRISLAIVSAICGFIFGYQLVLGSAWVLIFFHKPDSSLFLMDPFGIILIVLTYYGIPIVGGLFAITFSLISWGKFNSQNWRINRYVFIVLIPLVVLAASFIGSKISTSFFETGMKSKYSQEICSKITDEKQRSDCFFNSAIYQKDPNLCENVTISDHSGVSLDNCYTQASGALNSLSGCQTIKNLKGKDTCIEWVARIKNNISYCDQISDAVKKDRCYYYGDGTERNDLSICSKLISSEMRDRCYNGVAMKKDDYTICQNVSTGSESCIFQASRYSRDKKGCEFLKDPQLKTSCLNQK